MVAEFEDAGLGEFFIVFEVEADGLFVGAGLADDIAVGAEGFIHEGFQVEHGAEGGFGAEFAVGEDFGHFLFGGQMYIPGVELRAEFVQIDLAAGGQDAHIVLAVGLDEDRFGDVHAGHVLFGGHVLGGEGGPMGTYLILDLVLIQIFRDLHDRDS